LLLPLPLFLCLSFRSAALFVIPQRSGGICFAFVFLVVIPEGNLLSPSPFCCHPAP
jgi:hypothetical protein